MARVAQLQAELGADGGMASPTSLPGSPGFSAEFWVLGFRVWGLGLGV